MMCVCALGVCVCVFSFHEDAKNIKCGLWQYAVLLLAFQGRIPMDPGWKDHCGTNISTVQSRMVIWRQIRREFLLISTFEVAELFLRCLRFVYGHIWLKQQLLRHLWICTKRLQEWICSKPWLTSHSSTAFEAKQSEPNASPFQRFQHSSHGQLLPAFLLA